MLNNNPIIHHGMESLHAVFTLRCSSKDPFTTMKYEGAHMDTFSNSYATFWPSMIVNTRDHCCFFYTVKTSECQMSFGLYFEPLNLTVQSKQASLKSA